ncbi:MAG: oxidoreductase-like protein [Ferruginibacter sp.]|nr:oxidoreductase-like protein [Ferruginibacter sp.]
METLIATKPRLAFAGVGWIGRARMKAVADSNLAEMSLIADPSEACLQEAFKIAPATKITGSFDELLSDKEIDGVVIATPSALHMQQAVAAFKENKAVFCQKPLGRNRVEVSAVVNTARRNNRLLGADFSYRYTNAFQKILSIIRSGELGKIFAVDLKFHNAYGPDKPWFYDFSLSGGGCALDLGIHLVDLMLYALDFPKTIKINSSLMAKGISVKGKKEVEDYAAVTMDLEDDITAQLACSWNLPAGSDAIIEAGFYGTKGAVALKNVAGSFYDFVALRYWGTKTETIVASPDDWGGKALLRWIKQLSTNNHFNREAEQYLQSAEVLDKIYGRMD